MPNHVMNHLIVNGKISEIKKFFAEIKSGHRLIDFNKLIPQPEFIKLPDNCDGFSSFIVDYATLLMIRSGYIVKDYNGKAKTESRLVCCNLDRKYEWKDEDFIHLVRCCKAIQETGFAYWWDWNCYNWGTKWNAYEISKENNTIKFQTAWSTPSQIWRKIAEKYQPLSFRIDYADEDYGANCGTIVIENGIVNYEVKDLQFAYDVWGYSAEEETGT